MKLETLRSIRNMAGLPPLTTEEEARHKKQEFELGDATAQDEPDGRQSWYIEAFVGDEGHYSIILMSDGEEDIVEGSGPSIDVNSSLGQKMIAAARARLEVGKTFTLENSASQTKDSISGHTVAKPDLHYPKFEELVDKTMQLWKKYPEAELQEFVKLQLHDAFNLGYTAGYNSRN